MASQLSREERAQLSALWAKEPHLSRQERKQRKQLERKLNRSYQRQHRQHQWCGQW